jgi:hypothetical protein
VDVWEQRPGHLASNSSSVSAFLDDLEAFATRIDLAERTGRSLLRANHDD